MTTHLAAHGMSDGGGNWIADGLGHAEGACPFCGQNIEGLPLRIMDTVADKIVTDVPGGNAPDGAAYDPFSKHVFVANHTEVQ